MANNRKITADKVLLIFVRITQDLHKPTINLLFTLQLKKHVHETFDHIRKALDIRQRLLTRQIDVLATNPINPQNGGHHINLLDQMKFIPENETNVLNGIRIFGKFNIDNYNFYNDTTFAIEDYICPNIDHELMYKCLNSDEDSGNRQVHDSKKDINNEANEQVVTLHKGIDIDFSHNKRLINANNHLNESIVNMTVSESKELIAKSSNLTKFEEFMYDGLTPNSAVKNKIFTELEDVNIANLLINNLQQDELVDCQQQPESAATNQKKSKRKIKIHNYNGTINLKNISSLTINTGCNREPSVRQSKAVNTKKPLSKTSSNASSNKSSNTSPSSVSSHDEQNHQTDPDSASYNCEFYNRLLNEIKNNFSNTAHADHTNNNISNYDGSNSSFTSSTASTTSSSSSANPADGISGACNKMMFRNIRNLKINIPVSATKNEKSNDTSASSNPTSITNSSTTQHEPMLDEPESEENPHIEQWLKQIILETETEPMQNTDILEHSILHNKQMLNANIIAAAITTGKM